MFQTLGRKDKGIYGKDFHVQFKVGNTVCQKYMCKNKNMTPLAIDLDRSGAVESIRGEFVIDITGDSFVETLADWFAPTEGILIDTSFDGLQHGIVTGQHLFGNMGGAYLDGFEKLATHDLNGDGVVSGDELEFLAIWTDTNSNAKLDAGELSTLVSHNIVGLNTAHINLKSTVILADGSSLLMEDLVFSEEELESIV
jgi:hypothetical protein